MNRYSHGQLGLVPIVAAEALTLYFVLMLVFRGFHWALVAGILLASLVTMNFVTLTVTIDEEALRLRFGIGLIRKAIRLSEIASCEPVRNRWWYGWGIRLTPHGMLYNVSGLGAVEVRLRDGKAIRVGSDEPEALAAALKAAIRA